MGHYFENISQSNTLTTKIMGIDTQTKDEHWRGSEGRVSSQAVMDAKTAPAVQVLYVAPYILRICTEVREKIRQDAS